MFKNKLNFGLLEIIVFSGGVIVLVLELLASRILAPYLGTSIFVWSALLGIILGALSSGYYIGGHLSKKNPSMKFLGLIFLYAGVYLIGVELLREPVLEFSATLGVKMGSVFATLFLFAIPSVLYGMASPYAIRLKIKSVEDSGVIAGNLYAISTIGSIVGAFLAGFYLIPTFGASQILIGLGLASIFITILIGLKKLGFMVLFSILIIVFFASVITRDLNYLFEADSEYNHIRVADIIETKTNRLVRSLFLATELHSAIYKDSDEFYAKYHQMYYLDNLFKPDIKKALTLGGGAYIAPMNFLKRYPESLMTVVEIDPKVTQVAKGYFGLTNNDRLDIIHDDARIFLNQNQEQYDIIYGDAFASYFSIPFHLTTIESIQKIYNSLTDDGVFMLNIISSLEGESSLFLQAEYLTLQEVFKNIYVFPVHQYLPEHDSNSRQNIILVATKDDKLSKDQLLEIASVEQKELLKHLWEKEIQIDDSIQVLTDEYAPVDYYISKFL